MPAHPFGPTPTEGHAPAEYPSMPRLRRHPRRLGLPDHAADTMQSGIIDYRQLPRMPAVRQHREVAPRFGSTSRGLSGVRRSRKRTRERPDGGNRTRPPVRSHAGCSTRRRQCRPESHPPRQLIPAAARFLRFAQQSQDDVTPSRGLQHSRPDKCDIRAQRTGLLVIRVRVPR